MVRPELAKTRVAIDFGLRAKSLFKCTFLVSGTSPEGLRASFAGLHVFATTVPPATEQEQIELVRRYLNEIEKWLLILTTWTP